MTGFHAGVPAGPCKHAVIKDCRVLQENRRPGAYPSNSYGISRPGICSIVLSFFFFLIFLKEVGALPGIEG